jgi:L-asparaginase
LNPANSIPSVLVIYTGGTIGMYTHPESGVLVPFRFEQITQQLPELKRFGYQISTISFDPPVDSSNMEPHLWVKLAEIIRENYAKFDGFVVLHGTDTLAYTASALSFMLKYTAKPVIFTGSQLPLGMLRTDGKENIITAIEIAAAKKNDFPIVPEVCIYFENKLYRANRTTKQNSQHFNAFRSYNYPELATVGVNITYHEEFIHHGTPQENIEINTNLCTDIGILKIFPGMTKEYLCEYLKIKRLRALVLETFGSGNATTESWFIDCLKQATERGLVMVNISQCVAGSVDMGKYETGIAMKNAGIVSGHDMTTEAALIKLMHLLGQNYPAVKINELMEISLAGEMTIKK